MIAFTMMRLINLFSNDDPYFSMTTHWNENGVDLWDLDFMFAIENLDPAYGRI